MQSPISRPMVRIESSEPDERQERESPGSRRVSLWAGQVFLGLVVIGGSAMILAPAVSEPDGKSSGAAGTRAHVQLIQAGAFSPDGKTFATCGLDNAVRLWDVSRLKAGSSSEPVVLPHQTIQYAVAFSPEGSLLAAVGPRSLTIWSGRTGQYVQKLRKEIEPSTCVVFSPDGNTLAIGSDDGFVALHVVSSGLERMALRAHDNAVRSLSFSPDGRSLVSAAQDSRIILWDTVRGISVRSLLQVAPNPNHIFAFSPDGRTVAVGEIASIPTEVVLLDPDTGAVRTRLTGHAQGVCALAFSPDGRTLATAGIDHCVKVWNLPERREQTTLSNDVGSVNSFSFSGDGASLVFAGDGDTIKVWDRVQPKSPRLGYIPLRHSDGVTVTSESSSPPPSAANLNGPPVRPLPAKTYPAL